MVSTTTSVSENSSMRNRKREFCTSGSVRDEGGNILIYSAARERPARSSIGGFSCYEARSRSRRAQRQGLRNRRAHAGGRYRRHQRGLRSRKQHPDCARVAEPLRRDLLKQGLCEFLGVGLGKIHSPLAPTEHSYLDIRDCIGLHSSIHSCTELADPARHHGGDAVWLGRRRLGVPSCVRPA
jgi:hypothetical protein